MCKKVTYPGSAASTVMPGVSQGGQSKAIFLRRPTGPEFPVKLLLLLSLILLAAMFLIVQANIREEQARMLEYMKNRADVLIWTLEGSARTLSLPWSGTGGAVPSRPGGHKHDLFYAGRQLLLEQAVLQPAVEYIAICNRNGKVLAHNDPGQVGTYLYPALEMQSWEGLNESTGHYVNRSGKNIFEVVKAFTPRSLPLGIRSGAGHMRRGHMSGAHHGGHDFSGSFEVQSEGPQSETAQPDAYIFIGLDAAPFEHVLAQSTRGAWITAATTAFAGISCLALVLLLRNFRSSRRDYHQVRVLTFQVFDNLPLGLVVAGKDGSLLLYNQHAANMLGLPDSPVSSGSRRANLEKQHGLEAYPVLDWQGLQAQVDQGGFVVDRELEIDRQGSVLPVSLNVSPIKDYDGNDAGYLYILRDLKEVNRLKEQVRRGERLSALGNLAAGVAHEIRNPLSALKGYLTWLGEKLVNLNSSERSEMEEAFPVRQNRPGIAGGDLEDTFKGDKIITDVVRLMSDEVERLDKVVAELLGVARAGRLNLQDQNLFEVVQRAVRLARPEAEQKNIRIELAVALSPEETLALIDKDRLLQALLNILINAVQASPENAEIRVEINREKGSDAGSSDELLRVSVTDNGPGIPYDVQSELFTPYFTTKPEGTGLGLTITHQIVEQHQGRLEVFSLPGKGSRFSIILPSLK